MSGGRSALAPASTRLTGRIVAVDVARGLAILGMLIAHVIPRPDDAELLVDGRSSILFASLAGVSLGLMTGGASPLPRAERAAARTSIAIRAVVLILLGLLLWLFPHGIAIILDYYGIMFLLLIPLLFANRLALAVVGAALLLIAPPLAASSAERVADPWALDWFLTGYYPALVWLPLLITGLIASRSDLTRLRTQLLLTAGGAAAMLLGYGSAILIPDVTAEAHSSTLAEILGSGGFAFTMLGVLLLVTSPRMGALAVALRAVLWPVAAAGSMPLTIYTGQILALTIAVFALSAGDTVVIDYTGWPLLIALIVGSLLFASGWRALFGTGPLELVMRRLSGQGVTH
jgi:uncharacterized membrane protein YeiB